MKVPIQITDPAHPHAREYGVLDDELHPDALSLVGMYLVTLENCAHGSDGCYAFKTQCRRSTTDDEEESHE